MIYSNFPYTIKAERVRFGGRIIIGTEKKYIQAFCPVGTQIEKGLNPTLDFDFNRKGSLVVKKYDEDWRNFDDPYWNIPDNLFLLLTANITNSTSKSLCKESNGTIKTLGKNNFTNFKLYGRKNLSTGRYGFWVCGIYKVFNKPCVIKITPPGTNESNFLIVYNQEVKEFQNESERLFKMVHSLGISQDLSREEWVPL